MAKILLVDDEPRIARVVRDMVEGAEWQFAYADNGADALDAVARDAPDLIIMDVMMPKMDGFTACRELRARGVTVPVIFLSAKGDIVDKGVGFAAGGDDYMVKPFDPRELMMHIEAHLRRAAMRPSRYAVHRHHHRGAPFPRYGPAPRATFGRRSRVADSERVQDPGDAGCKPRHGAFPRTAGGGSLGTGIRRRDQFHHRVLKKLRAKIEDDPTEPRIIETVWASATASTRRPAGKLASEPCRQTFSLAHL